MLTKMQIGKKILRLQIKIMDDLEEDGGIRAEHLGRSCLTVGHPERHIRIETKYNEEAHDFDFTVIAVKNEKNEITTIVTGETHLYIATDIIRNYVELYNVDKNYTGYLEGC